MLAVLPVNYVFTNPIAYGSGDRALPSLVQKLAELTHVSEGHLAILSDRAKLPTPPTKDVIELNVGNFLKSCRPQDRVVLVFVGHAIEKDGKGYFLPIEGDNNDGATLIPLEWFYTQLKECPAQEKVFLVDVCRYDPWHGDQRGKAEPMGKKFDEALKNPPPGIQVWTACTAGQFSFETNDVIAGSQGGVMFNQLLDLSAKGELKNVVPKPEGPMAIPAILPKLDAATKSFTKGAMKKEQSVRLSGKQPEKEVPDDPKTTPQKFEFKLPDRFTTGAARAEDLAAVLRVANEVPPVISDDKSWPLNFGTLPPYSAKALEPFKLAANEKDTPFRAHVQAAIKSMKATPTTFPERFLAPTANNPQQLNAFKDDVIKHQKQAGILQEKLAMALDEDIELPAMEAGRVKEPKSWQATYDLVRARLHARLAYVYEYNIKLGELRKDFPPRDAATQIGWRLAGSEHKDPQAEREAKEARRILEKMAQEFKGTPWELIARREQLLVLGLDWQPIPR